MFRIARNIAEAEYPELWQGLVGAWSPCLQTHKNNILYDLSGKGNHGTLQGMDTSDWVTSGGTRALDFDGSNDFVELSKRVALDVSQAFMVNAWVATTTTGTRTIFCQSTNGGDTSNTFYLVNGTVQLHQFPPSGGNLATTDTVNDGLVHMVTVGFRGSTRFAAIDGRIRTLDTSAEVYTGAATTHWRIGAQHTGGVVFPFGGQILEVLVWQAYDPSVIPLLYRLGPGGWAQKKNKYLNKKHFIFPALAWNTIDTRNKRASSLSVSVPTGRAYMLPDGSLRNRADKRHQTLNYRFADQTYAITLGGSVNIEDLLRVNTSQSTNLGWLLQLSMPNTRTTLYPTLTHRVSRENKLPARNVSEAKYPELWKGLVGAWSPALQRHKNNILYDLSGNNNHGVLTNMDPATDWVTSGGRQTLDFDGSNYVACGNSGWPNGKHWSLSSWIRLGTMSSSTLYVLCRTGMSSGGAYFGINRLTPANIRWRFTLLGVTDYDFAASTLYGVDDGLWHHVGLWHDGNNALLFVDGKQVESKSVGTAVIPSGNTNIGFFDNGVNFGFVGQVSDLVIRNTTGNQLPLMYRLGPGGWAAAKDREFYSLTRNTNENTILSCESLSRLDSSPITAQVLYPTLTRKRVVNNYRPPARNASEAKYPELWKGLVGAWSPALQRHKNNILYDLSGNKNHGTLTNMDTSDWVISGGKQALDFNGNNNYIVSPIINKVQTVSGWFYPTTPITDYRRLWQWGINEFSAYLDINTYNLQIVFSGVSSDFSLGGTYNTGAVLSHNKWTHIASTYFNGVLRTYINGLQVSSHTTGINSTNKNFYIGTSTPGVQLWTGRIDDVLIWPYGIGQNIFTSIYNLGRGGWATPKERSFYLLPQKTPLHVTPIEALTSVNPGVTTFNEWLSNLLLPSITLIEYQGPAAETFYSVLNTESLEGINNSNTIPLEYQGATALAVYPVINLENLAQLARDNSVVTENITQLAGSHTIDKEFIGRLLHSNTITLEDLLTTIRDGYIATEGLSTARVNPALNVEIIGNLKSANIANIEWHSSLLQSGNLNLEYLQGVSVYPVFQAELNRLLSISPTLDYDLRSLLRLESGTDIEFNQSLSRSGVVDFENLLGCVYSDSTANEILAFIRNNNIVVVEYGVLPLTSSSYDWTLEERNKTWNLSERLRVWAVDNKNRTWIFLNHGGRKVENL